MADVVLDNVIMSEATARECLARNGVSREDQDTIVMALERPVREGWHGPHEGPRHGIYWLYGSSPVRHYGMEPPGGLLPKANPAPPEPRLLSSFGKDICANPRDPVRRRIAADFLEESGENKLAQVLRTSAAFLEGTATRGELMKGWRQYLNANGLRRGGDRERVQAIQVTDTGLLLFQNRTKLLPVAGPLADRLASDPAAAFLEHAQISGSPATIANLAQRLPAPEKLELYFSEHSAGLVERESMSRDGWSIAMAKNLAGVRQFTLNGGWQDTTRAAMQALFSSIDSPWLAGVARLSLTGHGVDGVAGNALRCPQLTGVRQVKLADHGGGRPLDWATMVPEMVAAPLVTELEVENNGLNNREPIRPVELFTNHLVYNKLPSLKRLAFTGWSDVSYVDAQVMVSNFQSVSVNLERLAIRSLATMGNNWTMLKRYAARVSPDLVLEIK